MKDEAPLPPIQARLLVWWIIWAAILGGLVVIYFFPGRGRAVAPPEPNFVLNYIGVVPLALSAAIRWLVLPQVEQRPLAFIVFVIGLSLAEGCGILGIFLSTQPAEFAALGALGIAQWAPWFAGRYERAFETGRTRDAR